MSHRYLNISDNIPCSPRLSQEVTINGSIFGVSDWKSGERKTYCGSPVSCSRVFLLISLVTPEESRQQFFNKGQFKHVRLQKKEINIELPKSANSENYIMKSCVRNVVMWNHQNQTKAWPLEFRNFILPFVHVTGIIKWNYINPCYNGREISIR